MRADLARKNLAFALAALDACASAVRDALAQTAEHDDVYADLDAFARALARAKLSAERAARALKRIDNEGGA